MKIIDCFIFNDEIKLLELRLKELYDVVDHFILVEATNNFNGNSFKKLIYNENKHLFAKFNHKITHIIVDDLINIDFEWHREYYQRNSIIKGINQLNLEDNDIILIHDVDEIPSPKLLNEFKIYNGFNIFQNPKNNIYLYPQNRNNIQEVYSSEIIGLLYDFYYYNLECRHTRSWWFPKALTYKKLKEIKNIQDIRMWDSKNILFTKAGWHFSYFGGVKSIIKKLEEFSHQEYNNEYWKNKERISRCCVECKDLFDRDDHYFERVDISKERFLPKNYKLIL